MSTNPSPDSVPSLVLEDEEVRRMEDAGSSSSGSSDGSGNLRLRRLGSVQDQDCIPGDISRGQTSVPLTSGGSRGREPGTGAISPVGAELQEMYGLVSNRNKDSNEKKNSCKEFWAAQWSSLTSWLLDVEMGVVWSVASLSIISFIFASIWYIDPALLTMVLQFQRADCTTVKSAYLIGISNCSWSSCRHGCTAEVYKCWQVEVNFTLVPTSHPIPPPWGSLTSLAMPQSAPGPILEKSHVARLYPNVRGCGYPPDLQCPDFFKNYSLVGQHFKCWVSHLDPEIAITELDLKRLKKEVMYSLVPLAVFILFTLYAFCRLGVFSICNPFRCCPTPADQAETATLTPKQLFRYKKTLMAKKAAALQSFQKCDVSNLAIPATIVESEDGDKIQTKEENDILDELDNFRLGVSFDEDESVSPSDKQKFVFVESELENGRQLKEPCSDRIEIAVSPVR